MHNPDQYYIEQSQLADTLTTLIGTKEWAVFKAEVLDKLYLSAFDSFQKADAGESLRIIQIQQQAVAINNIENRINALIREGDLARDTLTKLNLEGETYE